MIRSNRHILFVVSLLVLTIAATNIPSSAAIEKVGEIVLDPTHAVPGTLVSFEGIGWDLNTFSQCIVDGYPVKIDSHAICRVHVRLGVREPFGTFVVKDVPAGTYSVSIVADPYPYSGTAPPGTNYTGEVPFTVDASTTVTTRTTAFTTTMATPEAPQNSILMIFTVTILAVAVLRTRKKPSS